MANEWPIRQLEELVVDIIDRRGVTPAKLGSDFTANGHRVISAKLIKGSRIDLNADEPRFVDSATYRRWMATPLCEDDVIMTSEAPLGEVAYIERSYDWCLGQRLFAIRTDKNILNGRYLFYALKSDSVRNDLISRSTGTTVTGIRQSELRKVAIPVPPLSDQKRIAGILGALDDKIELNRRMNETLEQMARALFKSWFVDFEPVHAKAAGRQPFGMDKATADLFPDSFEDSELGKIPKGWKLKSVGEVVELAYGKPLKEGARKGGPICVYGANGPIGWHNEKLVNGPGIIVGRKGTPGVVTWAQDDFYPIDTSYYVVPLGSCRSLYFIYYALRFHNLSNLSVDSGVPGLNRNHAYACRQVLPPPSLLEAFDLLLSPIFSAVNANVHEARAISTLRDTLLPRLLSGTFSMPSQHDSQ